MNAGDQSGRGGRVALGSNRPAAPPMRRRRIVALRLYQVVSNVLLDPITIAWRVLEAPSYVANLVRYRGQQARGTGSFRLRFRYLYPVLGDRHSGAGVASGHYFHQDIWAARDIHRRNPARHVDVGSSVAGFIAHLLCFREVEYVDIRELDTNVSGLRVRLGNITALPYASDEVESLSALHVGEHVGLGRYGDPVDAGGWLKAIGELRRVLRPGGVLYYSVPIGRERLEFDAHRVFDPPTIVEAFRPLRLAGFSYVSDDGRYVGDADIRDFDGWYGCGLFTFTKD
jgi:SAM-dependent methyltransferase